MGCRAISPAAQYARRSALCPAGIRTSAPGYVLELLASGFEFIIDGMECGIGMIAESLKRQRVADIVVLFMCCRAISLRSIRTTVGAMPCGHTRLCARLCTRPLCGLCAYAGRSFSLKRTVISTVYGYTESIPSWTTMDIANK